MKVFGIGLSKTGTTSFAEAMRLLGLSSVHYPLDFLEIENKKLKPNFDIVESYDFLNDTPIARFYIELDKKYPDAKFILTTRDMDAWLGSCRKFFYPFRFMDNLKPTLLHQDLYNCEHFKRKKFKCAYKSHQENIINYFAGRNDKLLVIDVCSNEGWDELCAFLGLEVPNIPFPHKHQSTTTKTAFIKIWIRGYISMLSQFIKNRL